MKIKMPYFIAEVGVNHEGCINKAVNMIESASRAGADAVKFQMYKADELAIVNSPSYWDTKKEPTESQHKLFSKFDAFDDKAYEHLSNVCKNNNIEFMVTPFSVDGVSKAKILCNRIKLASADITNIPLLIAAAKSSLPIILSTGASNYEEIEKAISLIHETGNKDITLLHCVLNYPTDPKDAYLKRISLLKEKFHNCKIGYSDHVPPHKSKLTPIISVLMGAEVIEKHYTFDKSIQGNDHYHSYDEIDLSEYIKNMKETIKLIGEDITQEDFINQQLPAIQNARRSIVSNTFIKKGDVLSDKNITTKRPGTGIPASKWDEVIQKKAARDIEKDVLLNIDDVI